jgi:aryl-alcohol dehydrogenase-like predicted oxidoreductase
MEAFGPRNAQERTWKVIDTLSAIATARGVSMAQTALAWLAAQPAVTSVLLGARKRDQLADNLAAAKLTLTSEEIAHLSDASKPEMSDYPYGAGGIAQRNRKIEGGR